MHIERLKAVAERIALDPTSFWMPDWRLQNKGEYPYIFGKGACGTACCVSGHALQIAYEEGRRHRPYSVISYMQEGAAELGITEKQAGLLFSSHNWPNQFRVPYIEAVEAMRGHNDPALWEKAACIGAARIKHFIDTNGEE